MRTYLEKIFKLVKKNQKLLLIFTLALFLRTYKLGTLPVGFHADEVRTGWNSYSILKTGIDDRGKVLSLYYNTFGDFRPTGIFYLTIPSIFLFGLTQFSVRFPSAIVGALSLFPLFLLTKELQKNKKVPLYASFFLAVSPWHISVSRATSEVAISMFFALFGLYFFMKLLKGGNKKFSAATIIFFVVSYLLYHSARILVPIFVFGLLIYLWKDLKNIKYKKLGVVVLLVLSITTIVFAANKEARGRFSQVSIFHDLDVKYELSRMPFEEGPNKIFIARMFHNKPLVYARRFIKEYASYFSANFLIGNEGKPQRYMTPGVGVLTYLEASFLIFGLFYLAKKRASSAPLLLLLAAPIAAALTTEDAPNLHRAFYMLPFLSIVQSYGVIEMSRLKNRQLIRPLLLGLFTLNFVFYAHMYLTHAKYTIAASRSYGTKQLSTTINATRSDYDQIYLTNVPDDVYPWLAFFGRYDPKVFNKSSILREHGVWSYGNLVFTGQRCPSRDVYTNPTDKKILVVDAEGCATESNLNQRDDVHIRERVLRPDESEVFILWTN